MPWLVVNSCFATIGAIATGANPRTAAPRQSQPLGPPYCAALSLMAPSSRPVLTAASELAAEEVGGEAFWQRRVEPVHEFWHRTLQQRTLHVGDACEDEEPRGVAFYAFLPQRHEASGAVLPLVPVHEHWHRRLRQLTYHPGAPRLEETARGLQFLALCGPSGIGAVPCYEYLHPATRRCSWHTGAEWSSTSASPSGQRDAPSATHLETLAAEV